ncbi:MAG TPA: flagellar hook-basal body complex protein FliE [Terracidiphilus sp.]|jgi:flagellar hook-basal body complex protein FliE|nr:flagellar hook-basal body complex protein FliE [Terracidiphilus sp.]
MSNVTFGPIPNFQVPQLPSLGSEAGSGSDSFGSILSNAVNNVNALNDNAASQVSSLLQGGGADLNNVMIAVEKADVSFQLMMQVRNKIVSAYQDIEKMQF